MRSYELQVFREGAWKIDSVFDDAEIALLEARRADEGKRYASIRVIEENYDETTDRTWTRTLFRGGAVQAKLRERAAPAKDEVSAPRGGTGHEPDFHSRGGAAPASSGWLVPILLLLLVVVGGLAMLFGLKLLLLSP